MTVVVPAHNEERTLPRQLDSLLSQTWDGQWELVVADNRSSDRTAEVAKSYARRDDRVRLLGAHDHAGLAYVRNVAMADARAEAVAFVDADDVVGQEWLPSMGAALRLHPYVTGPLELDKLNPPWLAGSRGRRLTSEPPNFHAIFSYAAGGNHGIWRSAWSRVGGYREDIHTLEDVEFGLRLWLAGVPLHFEPRAVLHYQYRQDSGSLWRQGFFYGSSRPQICRMLADAGVRTPSRIAGWKSWVWLLMNGPRLRSREDFLAWLWVAANRCGQLVGSVRERSLYL